MRSRKPTALHKLGAQSLLIIMLMVLAVGCSRPDLLQPPSPTIVSPVSLPLQASPTAPTRTPRTTQAPLATSTASSEVRKAASPSRTGSPGNSPQSKTPTSPLTGKGLADPTASPPTLLVLDPIQIRLPAVGADVASPIPLQVQFIAGDQVQLIQVELRRADGALLVRKLLHYNSASLPEDTLTDQIDFEIDVNQTGGLLIVSLLASPGNPIAINSVDLKLHSVGSFPLVPAEWQPKHIDIQQPAANDSASGGILHVSGLTRLPPDQVLKVQLLDSQGKVVGQRLAGISVLTDGASPTPTAPPGSAIRKTGAAFNTFEVDVPYKVTQPTDARLVVFSNHPQNGEINHLASLPVSLNP